MQKTRLGISIGLLGAAVYFMGVLGIIPLVLVAGYILLFEQNEWLKGCAVKAAVIYVLFALIPVVVGVIGDAFGFINVIIGWFPGTFRLSFPGEIDSLINIAAGLLRAVLLLVLGFTALSQGSVKTGKIDDIVNKNL